MSISAMKQALEALEKLWDIIDDIESNRPRQVERLDIRNVRA